MMMNRKDFKKLLVEWNQNFVNEKKMSGFGVDFKGLTKDQSLFVKKVPIDLNLYALGDFEIPTQKGVMPLSHFMFVAMSNSKHIEKKLSKSIILDKTSIEADIIPVLEVVLEELARVGFSYADFQGNIVNLGIDSNKAKEYIEKIILDLKEYALEPEGLVLYFARMSGSIESMADGTMNMVSTIKDEAVWKNSLQWELKHDLFHAFEDLFIKDKFYNFMYNLSNDPVIGEVIKNFKVPYASGGSSKDGKIDFSSSAGDDDNFASLVPHIRSLGNNEASKDSFIEDCNSVNKELLGRDLSDNEKNDFRKFFDAAHSFYDKIGSLLKGKVLIQKAHG